MTIKEIYMIGNADRDLEEDYQFEFTEEEIKRITLPQPLNLDMFDKVGIE